MHTVYEAKQLECRQQGKYMGTHWSFPNCSATACGHWITDTVIKRKMINAQRKDGFAPYSKLDEDEQKDFNTAIETAVADGWQPHTKHWDKVKSITFTKRLSDDELVGRCGLIFDPEINVDCSS